MNPAGERITLAVETAFSSVSVALQVGDRIVLPDEVPSRARASDLHPALQQCLTKEGLGTEAIDRILVDKGPGSYTGLRIGLSLARTLSHLHGTPILTLYSTDILAWLGRDRTSPNEEFLVALDARRIHWTLAGYRRSRSGITRVRRPEVLTREEFTRLADRAGLVLCAEDQAPTRADVVQLGVPEAATLFELEALAEPEDAPLPLYLMPAT